MFSVTILRVFLVFVATVDNISGMVQEHYSEDRDIIPVYGDQNLENDSVSEGKSQMTSNLDIKLDDRRSSVDQLNKPPQTDSLTPYSGSRAGIAWWPWNNRMSNERRSYFIPRLGKRDDPSSSPGINLNQEEEVTPAEAELLKKYLMHNFDNDYLSDNEPEDYNLPQEEMDRSVRSYAFVPRLGKKSYSFSPRLGKKGYSFSPRLGKKSYSFSPRLGKKSYSFSPRLGKKTYSFSPRLG